jgi:hypothetical protein
LDKENISIKRKLNPGIEPEIQVKRPTRYRMIYWVERTKNEILINDLSLSNINKLKMLGLGVDRNYKKFL